ncbi:MAG: hypothetical protein OEX10_02555 [Candidatus Bathyarchaeota archaeon]|nr:hypothetical protein [Candidatus Bathyarchaeota archaeon]MDH5662937.1 hypothetical protein [Candidatus Bathyarchaeota archaeon]
MGRRKRSYGIRRSKRLPYGRIVYGARVTPRGRRKIKVYARYEA